MKLKRSEMPSAQHIMSSRQIFKYKDSAEDKGSYKARLVIKGFNNSNHYDLSETYADIRFMLAVANKYDFEVSQMDIKTAFLNGNLEKAVYMEILNGMLNKDKYKTEYVCKLEKALYGLKVSPRRWYKKFRICIERLNFEVSPFQPCIFVQRSRECMIIALLYVNDILIVGNDAASIEKLKKRLSEKFGIKDLGVVNKFIGHEIIRDRKNRVMYLQQCNTVIKIIKRFGMAECKPVNTLVITHNTGKKGVDQASEILGRKEIVPFREIIGSILYVINCSRPDICYAVNVMSHRKDKYILNNVIKLKRILRYLREILNLGLKYEGKTDLLDCFVDALLGVNDSEGKSTSSLLVQLFGDVIMCRTKRQRHVVLSSAEAEFIGISLVCKNWQHLEKCTGCVLGYKLTLFSY